MPRGDGEMVYVQPPSPEDIAAYTIEQFRADLIEATDAYLEKEYEILLEYNKRTTYLMSLSRKFSIADVIAEVAGDYDSHPFWRHAGDMK